LNTTGISGRDIAQNDPNNNSNQKINYIQGFESGFQIGFQLGYLFGYLNRKYQCSQQGSQQCSQQCSQQGSQQCSQQGSQQCSQQGSQQGFQYKNQSYDKSKYLTLSDFEPELPPMSFSSGSKYITKIVIKKSCKKVAHIDDFEAKIPKKTISSSSKYITKETKSYAVDSIDSHDDFKPISWDEIDCDMKLLSSGGFGMILFCKLKNKNLNQKLVAKVMIRNKEEPIDKFMENIIREFKIGKMMNDSPYNIKYHTYSISECGRLGAIIMDYFDGINLLKYIETKPNLSREEIKTKFLSIVKAVFEMHKKGLCHRDIKSLNIMVSKDSEIKLIDYGISHYCGENIRNFTANWTAPEHLSRRTLVYVNKSDIYSLGCVLFELLTGKVPFDKCEENEILEKINAGEKDNIPDDYPELKLLAQQCMSYDPKLRPNIHKIISTLESM
jgi:hypothetical protein